MPTCQTRFHGLLEFELEQVLAVPAGLFGFADEREFLLLEIPSRRPMVFIQSTRTADLCFVALPVQVVDQSYQLVLTSSENGLDWRDATAELQMGRDLLCLALLTIADNKPATANLLAPLVIDIKHHKGVQVIVDGEYSHEHPISSPALSAPC